MDIYHITPNYNLIYLPYHNRSYIIRRKSNMIDVLVKAWRIKLFDKKISLFYAWFWLLKIYEKLFFCFRLEMDFLSQRNLFVQQLAKLFGSNENLKIQTLRCLKHLLNPFTTPAGDLIAEYPYLSNPGKYCLGSKDMVFLTTLHTFKYLLWDNFTSVDQKYLHLFTPLLTICYGKVTITNNFHFNILREKKGNLLSLTAHGRTKVYHQGVVKDSIQFDPRHPTYCEIANEQLICISEESNSHADGSVQIIAPAINSLVTVYFFNLPINAVHQSHSFCICS